MSRPNSILVRGAIAGLLLASTTIGRAEEVEKKFRIAFSLGGYGTTDQVHSASANRRTLFYSDGELYGRIYDPRNDSSAFSEFGIDSQLGGVLSASYSFNRLWYVEASAGYRRGDVGNLEMQAQFVGVQPPTNQDFKFSIFNLNAGTMTQIPVQLSVGIRFRPKAVLNPFLLAGVGYTFNSFEPSDELNALSRNLDQSTGGFRLLRGTQAGGESFGPAQSVTNLTGIEVSVPDAPEWHFGGGLEYSIHSKWVIFFDARYTVASGKFGLSVNGSDELGISVPSDRKFVDEPDAFGPFGAVEISTGGLADGGSWVPQVGADPDTQCTNASHTNCEFTGPKDGVNDPGIYYIHAGKIRWDGWSMQLGFKYTF